MKKSNESGRHFKWTIVIGDFLLLNAILFLSYKWRLPIVSWEGLGLDVFVLINNIALLLSQFFFSTIIYQRLIGAGDVIKRVVGLSITQATLAFVLLRVFGYDLSIGLLQLGIGTVFFILLLFKRVFERWFIRLYREAGRNMRSVTFVGSDPELLKVYDKMKKDPTLGYNVLGYYADDEIGTIALPLEQRAYVSSGGTINSNEIPEDRKGDERPWDPIKKLGTMQEFVAGLNHSEDLVLGDELYLCISRIDKKIIRRVSSMCDRRVIRFYYVPVSVESIGLNLKRELMDDIEVFTTYENPLQNPFNRILKRSCDVMMSLFFLIPTALLFPFIFIMMKIQSPGPILFRQKRTGLDGKEFEMLKFRSMHVNADADKVQATKDDPRKYPFGSFMRKTNIDELPQFINVLRGDMSIVGPRPHMLAHTEMYSSLIDKYMVRHFVKPGVTGWAQVTGFRGETKELWQMEGRVKRDIWYIENWSFWLDIRIVLMTVKTMFIHDKNAY